MSHAGVAPARRQSRSGCRKKLWLSGGKNERNLTVCAERGQCNVQKQRGLSRRGWGCTHVMHNRGRMAIDPGTPAMASRRMKGELHHMILRTACEAGSGTMCVLLLRKDDCVE